MKFSKGLFLAFAGLGLFACSNEDVTENGSIQGDATVSVKISDVISRALVDPTIGNGANGETFPVEITSATLTLEADQGGKEEPVTDQLKKLNDNNEATITFTNVRNPRKLTLVINKGLESGLELKNVVETGLAEPLYASTTMFSQTDATHYTATLTPKHRLARLQFSGIKFDATNGTSYTSLHLDGIYLNGALQTEGGNDLLIADGNDVWNTVSSWESEVYDAINKQVVGTGAITGSLPTDNQCYAYNILPNGTNLPKLTVCFSQAVQPGVTVVGTVTDQRFARVASYKIKGDKGSLEGIADDGTITEFVAGYIYNITNLSMSDKDLGITTEGGQNATLTATVQVLPWTLVNGTVEWE